MWQPDWMTEISTGIEVVSFLTTYVTFFGRFKGHVCGLGNRVGDCLGTRQVVGHFLTVAMCMQMLHICSFNAMCSAYTLVQACVTNVSILGCDKLIEWPKYTFTQKLSLFWLLSSTVADSQLLDIHTLRPVARGGVRGGSDEPPL